ncbi:MAG TPA: hypothetical protein VKM72_26480 [Thermoanaerobaculia bacterium]|nr:hypothetical protein [Thermoanaerobaculia bacterium]
MKALSLPAKLVLVLLILSTGAAVAAWRVSASFTPPTQSGNIFAVINADRSAGATTTSIAVDWRSVRNPGSVLADSKDGFILLALNLVRYRGVARMAA